MSSCGLSIGKVCKQRIEVAAFRFDQPGYRSKINRLIVRHIAEIMEV
jgi:hypothetical protein